MLEDNCNTMEPSNSRTEKVEDVSITLTNAYEAWFLTEYMDSGNDHAKQGKVVMVGTVTSRMQEPGLTRRRIYILSASKHNSSI